MQGADGNRILGCLVEKFGKVMRSEDNLSSDVLTMGTHMLGTITLNSCRTQVGSYLSPHDCAADTGGLHLQEVGNGQVTPSFCNCSL